MSYSEEEIIARVQQYVPDLRKHVQAQIKRDLAKRKKQIIQEKTQEVRQIYMTKLQQQAQNIKHNINKKQSNLKNKVDKIKQEIKDSKARTLTENDKKQLIEATVAEICSDSDMIQEIKRKLYDRVEARVFEQMQSELFQQLQKCKEQFMQQTRSNHEEWEEDRYEHWRNQSSRELEVLAQQYRELQCKKSLIQESLATKKTERDSLLRQQKAIHQKNSQIQAIKRQIKLLA